MITISEAEFSQKVRESLKNISPDCVTGPGRSGAIAAVYASHILRIPYIPYGAKVPKNLPCILIIDTATETGKTLRKAKNKYKENFTHCIAVYNEPPRVCFWYESSKPQRFKHESQK